MDKTTDYDVTVKTLRVHGRDNYGHDTERNPLIVECLEPGCYLKLSAPDQMTAFTRGRTHQASPQCPFDPLRFKQK